MTKEIKTQAPPNDLKLAINSANIPRMQTISASSGADKYSASIPRMQPAPSSQSSGSNASSSSNSDKGK